MMKRIVAVLLVCFLCMTALCEDLSAYSDAEVIELLAELQRELVERGIEKTASLPKGSYIAGRDLPVGSYIYTCRAVGNDWGNVTVYSSDRNQLLWEVVDAPKEGEEPETFMVRLEEGDELKSGVPFDLTIHTVVVFK